MFLPTPMVAAPPSNSSIIYAPETVQRAERAVRCAPFQPMLYQAMGQKGIALQAIAGSSGVQKQFTLCPLSETTVEDDLLWLIQVGVLRREVDGQGLTDSFRLTPLGRQLLHRWAEQGVPSAPSWGVRLQNLITRWVPIPGLK